MKTELLIAIACIGGCTGHVDRAETQRLKELATASIQTEIDATLPTCASDADCGVLWEKAKTWAALHSADSHLAIGDDQIRVTVSAFPIMTLFAELKPLAEKQYLHTEIFCARPDFIFLMKCGNEDELLRLEFHKAMSQ